MSICGSLIGDGPIVLIDRQRHFHLHRGTDRGGNEYGCGVGSCFHAGDIYGECEVRSLSGGVTAGGWGDGQPWLGWIAYCPFQCISACILQVDGSR